MGDHGHDEFDVTAEDWEDFDDVKRPRPKNCPRRDFIDDEDENGFGLWKGEPLSDMTVSHLQNTVKLLEQWYAADDHRPYRRKIKEMEKELESRANGTDSSGKGGGVNRYLVRKNSFTVTNAMILDAARAAGLKIPKSGAGVYRRDKKVDDGDIEVRFDTTHTVKLPKAKKVRKGKKS